MRNSNFTPVKDLNALYVNVTPVNYDWSTGYGETWEAFAKSECYECKQLSDSSGQCQTESCPKNGEYADDEPPTPMMNYYYPLPEYRGDLETDTEAIKDLPLVFVHFLESDEWALALSGGGMDLSWEICEAFMRLGSTPPVHFCDLPAMAGRGTSKRDKWIMAGCRDSVQTLRGRLDGTIRRLRQVAQHGREYERRQRKEAV